MEENQKGSPDATLLSKLGSDIKVLNLRPEDKSKMMNKNYFRLKNPTAIGDLLERLNN